MIKLLAHDDEQDRWLLVLLLEAPNIDRLLKDEPIRFSGSDINLPVDLQFVLAFDTPGMKPFLARLEEAQPAAVCLLLLPLETEPTLRAGTIIETTGQVGALRFKFGISMIKDIKETEALLRRKGMLGVDTVVRRTGRHPEERLETPN